MLKTNKSTSVTATSSIEIEENGTKVTKVVAYMNANIPENGDLNINKSIQDKELFKEYKDSVTKDFEDFENYVYEL